MVVVKDPRLTVTLQGVVEGVVVEEGQRIAAPRSGQCWHGQHTLCPGIRMDLEVLLWKGCECTCHPQD